MLQIAKTRFDASGHDGNQPTDSQYVCAAGRECASTLELIARLLQVEGSVCQVKAQSRMSFGQLRRKGDRLVRIGKRPVEIPASLRTRRVLACVKRLDERSSREREGVVRVEADRFRIRGSRTQIVLAAPVSVALVA